MTNDKHHRTITLLSHIFFCFIGTNIACNEPCCTAYPYISRLFAIDSVDLDASSMIIIEQIVSKHLLDINCYHFCYAIA